MTGLFPESVPKEPQNRPRRRRQVDVVEVGKPMSTMSIWWLCRYPLGEIGVVELEAVPLPFSKTRKKG